MYNNRNLYSKIVAVEEKKGMGTSTRTRRVPARYATILRNEVHSSASHSKKSADLFVTFLVLHWSHDPPQTPNVTEGELGIRTT